MLNDINVGDYIARDGNYIDSYKLFTGVIYIDKKYENHVLYPTFVFNTGIYNDSVDIKSDTMLTLSDFERLPVEDIYSWDTEQKAFIKKAILWCLTKELKCDI